MYDKIKKLITVLNYFIDNVPDVPHNTVQEYGEYYYIRKPYTVLIFSTYEDANSLNQISSSVGIVNYGKPNSLSTCHKGFGSTSEMYSITKNEIFFSSLIMPADIDKDEYFTCTLEYNMFLNYEELQLLRQIKEPGATININNI